MQFVPPRLERQNLLMKRDLLESRFTLMAWISAIRCLNVVPSISSSTWRVQRLMQAHGIQARGKRRFRVMTTDSRHDLPIAPNLLDRNFTVVALNTAWSGDITSVATGQRMVVSGRGHRPVLPSGGGLVDASGYALDPGYRSALEMAWYQRRPDMKAGLIFHSDRGSQCASGDFGKVLEEYGTQSASDADWQIASQREDALKVLFAGSSPASVS